MTKEAAEKYIRSKMCKNCSVYLGGGKCSDNCKVIEAIKALEQPDITSAGEGGAIYYPQVEGVTPTVVSTKTIEQEPSEDVVRRQVVKEQMNKYGFHAPDMAVTEFVEDLPPANP